MRAKHDYLAEEVSPAPHVVQDDSDAYYSVLPQYNSFRNALRGTPRDFQGKNWDQVGSMV